MKGFFSIIQYCPDIDRAELANVGVVLAVPSAGYLEVRISNDNECPKQRFGATAFDDARLTLAKTAIEHRIRYEGPSWQNANDLASFNKREGNHLVLSTPRTILLEQPAQELDELFTRLVHVDRRTGQAL